MAATNEAIRVAVVLNLPEDQARGTVLGMLRHLERTPRWSTEIFSPQIDQLGVIAAYQPHGVIAAIDGPDLLEWALSLKVPVVNVSNVVEQAPFPRVGVDDFAVGELAASHFIEMSFKNIAFLGAQHHAGARDREAGFRKRMGTVGVTHVHSFMLPQPAGHVVTGTSPSHELTAWLRSLRFPAATFAYDDRAGRLLTLACRSLDIHVPEKMAILGCGDDIILCQTNPTPLSSVSLPLERIGFEAAQLLDRLMAGESAPLEPVLLPVSSVSPRQSTNTTPIADTDVAAARRFIQAHAGEWIGVPEVLLAVPINRRSLERKFRQYMGRSPLEEIRRVRMEMARQLLATTDLSMPLVARQSGFSGAKQLSLVFRDQVGVTPSEYRRRFRVPDPTIGSASPADDDGKDSE